MPSSPEGGFDGTVRARQIAGDAQRLWEDAQEARSWLSGEARARVEASPFGMLAGAAFVGFVLAGGLAAPLGRRIISLAARYALGPLLFRGAVTARGAEQPMARGP